MAIIDHDDFVKQLAAQPNGLQFRSGWDLTRRMAAKKRWRIDEHSQGAVMARIDWGRWIADCPCCAGAEFVSRKDRRFFCLNCGMVGNDGHPMQVVFPPDAKTIEAELDGVPVQHQNWRVT